jgi:uncharacterized protein YdhG (YjbR/CyaY superfamily)
MSDKPTTTAEYLAAQPADKRATLRKLRATIRAAAPRAEESFSYGIPGFRLDGRPLIWFAAWSRHYALYPVSAAIVRAHATEGMVYETAKGTVRFAASKPLPFALVKKLVKARMAEVRAKKK